MRPGRITAHLRQLGVDAFGIDLSPGMIEVARRDHPGLRFDLGSMTDLALADASMAGLVAWYSLIHVPDDEISPVFAHFQRVLRPGGPLLLSFHVGDESQLKTQGYGGHPMRVFVHRRRHDQDDRVAQRCRLRRRDTQNSHLSREQAGGNHSRVHPGYRPGQLSVCRTKAIMNIT